VGNRPKCIEAKRQRFVRESDSAGWDAEAMTGPSFDGFLRVHYLDLQNNLGDPVIPFVGDADESRLDVPIGKKPLGLVVNFKKRPARGIVYHLDVGPFDPSPQAKSEGLQHRLFDGPAKGEMLPWVRLALAKGDFGGSEDPLGEEATPSVEHSLNAGYGNDIYPYPVDHGTYQSGYFIRSIISRTALSNPTKTLRATMLCPMLSSSISLISATRLTLK